MRLLSVILAGFMLVVVLSVAALFTFTGFMEAEMQGGKRITFIVLLWLYGIYRTYRLYVLQKNIKNNEV